ncbi:uncharacterized protein TRIADDRAFT_58552 [Trichoplax adhaerens]|uniref:Mediator of RNA polymerase II transcription subunit 24 n=1 Tax=Trichoplax adhaerens TaxID=10228 RepID=B3S307_TRIAD|nr:hypothetical protein TRIADDRAFT_58552 [Trichoplax adhaerens]EDV22710.1 hypothetical protein TRIADDRAFT_58552 [Trichoplax adhaerens]|eukprot:XP_002114576.1 hypothetical protein TRIADDRAFT_58552 [Trichoplax adhaerens]
MPVVGNDEQTQELQAFLIRCWKERWKPSRWAMKVRKFLLAKENSSKMLAELLLKQIFIGTIPNELLLSYMNYATTTQLISHTTFYSTIAQLVDFSKPRCMNRILELVILILPSTSCKTREDSLDLAKALLSLLSWLQTVCIMSIRFSQAGVTELCNAALTLILDNQNLCGLIRIGSFNSTELWNVVNQLGEQLCEVDMSMLAEKPRNKLLRIASKIARLTNHQFDGNPSMQQNSKDGGPSTSIQLIIYIQSLIRPLNSEETIACLLESVDSFKRINPCDFFVELYRACLTAISESASGSWDEVKIVCFTHFKLPKIIKALLRRSFMQQLISQHGLSFMKLTRLANLLDVIDKKLRCDTVSAIATSLRLENIITAKGFEELIKSRPEKSDDMNECNLYKQMDDAKSYLDRLLQLINAGDIVEVRSQINYFIDHMDVVLATAACSGCMKNLALALIRLNDSIKRQTSRGDHLQLFDVTFILLCSVIQRYGKQILTDDNQSTVNSFFYQWANQYLHEEYPFESQAQQVPKSASISVPCTPTQSILTMATDTVDSMLSVFTKSYDTEFDYSNLYQMCMMASGFVKEIIKPWHLNFISESTVKQYLDRLKGKASCLSIAIYAAWYKIALRSSSSERKKCFSCLNHIMENLKKEEAENANDKSRLNKLQLQREILSRICPENSLIEEKTRNNSTLAYYVYDAYILKLLFMGVNIISSSPLFLIVLVNSCGSDVFMQSKNSPYEIVSDIFSEFMTKRWLGCAQISNIFKLWSATSSDWFCEALLQMLNEDRGKDNCIMIADAIACLTLIHPTELIPTVFVQVIQHHLKPTIHQWKARALAHVLVRCMQFGLTYSGGTNSSATNGERPPKIQRVDEPFDSSSEASLAIYCMETAMDTESVLVENGYDDNRAESCFGKVFIAILETLLLKFREIFEKNHIGPSVTFAMYFLQRYCLTNMDLFLKPGLRKLAIDLIPLIPGQVSVDLLLRLHDLNLEEHRRDCAKYLAYPQMISK